MCGQANTAAGALIWGKKGNRILAALWRHCAESLHLRNILELRELFSESDKGLSADPAISLSDDWHIIPRLSLLRSSRALARTFTFNSAIAGHFTSFHQIHKDHQQRGPSKPLLPCHLFKPSGYDMCKRLLPVQFRGGLEIYAVPFLQEVFGSC